jgi:hypothetical protein
MKDIDILNSKTILEYLVLIHEKSYSQIGRELNITPQQFSDWIKKRRPIPRERLQSLCEYFELDKKYLVDDKQFARNINPITKIEIQIQLVKKIIESGIENVETYTAKMKELQKERLKQIRIARLASILHQENQQINEMIDEFLDKIETGNLERSK